jgi:DNA-binding PadR family transcriptional regulator
MSKRQAARKIRTTKMWVGGKIYRLTDKQLASLHDHIQDGKVSDDQEQRTLEWFESNGIEAVPVITSDEVTKSAPRPDFLTNENL